MQRFTKGTCNTDLGVGFVFYDKGLGFGIGLVLASWSNSIRSSFLIYSE